MLKAAIANQAGVIGVSGVRGWILLQPLAARYFADDGPNNGLSALGWDTSDVRQFQKKRPFYFSSRSEQFEQQDIETYKWPEVSAA
ncbi:hypothetical protein CSUB01_12414 [Colletotrichum sublineola]|uniref:Uncharacterized protein n=1 Tax=Colletotrichum sublineola TaxID=1173701 RepID=A0A066XF85_COLSU|nr:hypothetical protein CSUB01_12414 [Colletotrichum sublineola]